jgi:Mitotic-spindle organizing gamma-tubulin ring associated
MQGRRNFSAIRRKHFSSQSTAFTASSTNVNVNNNNNIVNDTDDDNNDNNNSNNNRTELQLQLVKKISDRLETGLNEYALRAIMDLLQRGEHPDAIVAAVASLSQRAATTTTITSTPATTFS